MALDLSKHTDLTFEAYRRRAQDPTLSEYEKIAFPNVYREGYGSAIFTDIRRKLTNLEEPGQTVLEIGPGCSEPARLMIALCREKGHTLVLVDSAEMLALLPDEPFIVKVAAYFPDDCAALFEQYDGKIDVLLSYSVLHSVFAEGNVYRFVDRALGLLADGGQALIGDVPNVSKRKRFFSSANGARYHKAFMQTDEPPTVEFNVPEPEQIDDAVLFSLVMRARAAGFDGYILAQAIDLPLANRREDLLFCKP